MLLLNPAKVLELCRAALGQELGPSRHEVGKSLELHHSLFCQLGVAREIEPCDARAVLEEFRGEALARARVCRGWGWGGCVSKTPS